MSLRWLQPPEILNVVVGIALAIVARQRAGHCLEPIPDTLGRAARRLGLTLLYCLWFALITLAFWLVRVEALGYLFYDVWQAGRYPVDYFKGTIRLLLTYVLPVAFATTFPAQALRGDLDPRIRPSASEFAALAS